MNCGLDAVEFLSRRFLIDKKVLFADCSAPRLLGCSAAAGISGKNPEPSLDQKAHGPIISGLREYDRWIGVGPRVVGGKDEKHPN